MRRARLRRSREQLLDQLVGERRRRTARAGDRGGPARGDPPAGLEIPAARQAVDEEREVGIAATDVVAARRGRERGDLDRVLAVQRGSGGAMGDGDELAALA